MERGLIDVEQPQDEDAGPRVMSPEEIRGVMAEATRDLPVEIRER